MATPARLNQRIRILFAIDSLVRGGTELQLAGLIERLDRERFEPWLLTIRETDANLVPRGCRHLQWMVPSLASPQGIRACVKLSRILRDQDISVVQTYFQDSTLLAGIGAWLARVPVRIACFRDMGFWRTGLQDLSMRLACGRMTDFIANAGVVRDRFVQTLRIDAREFHVIPNGVDVDALPFIPHAGCVTDIGIVGNMTRRVKRLDLFIRAAAILSPMWPQVRWHVIGDGELLPGIRALAHELGVGERVVFAGRVSDVADYLGRLQIGVLCSDSEGLSNAVIEYMLRGAAVVATAVGGNTELIRDGFNGLLVPAGDPAALAAAIRRVVEDDGLRHRLADAARADAEASYGWARCVAAHQDLWASRCGA